MRRETARGIVLKDEQVLMIQRRLKKGREYFSIPGGRVEAGESPEDTVVREILEEASIDVRVVALLGTFLCLERNEFHYIYRCEYIRGEPVLGDSGEKEKMKENSGVLYHPLWVPVDEVAEKTIQPQAARGLFIEILTAHDD